MKRLLLSLCLILLLASPCFAGPEIFFGVGVAAAGGGCVDSTHDGAGNAILLCEDFDGSTECDTGQASTCRKAWTTSLFTGTLDFAYTAGTLEGTNSLLLDCSSGTTKIYTSIAATGDVWVYAMLKIGTLNLATWDSAPIISLMDAGAALFGYIGIANRGGVFDWEVSAGTAEAFGTAHPAADTTYHVWFHWVKGTGANATGNLYVSTDATKPASAEVSTTTGSAAANAELIALYAYSAALDLVVIDHLRVSGSTIGSNPP